MWRPRLRPSCDSSDRADSARSLEPHLDLLRAAAAPDRRIATAAAVARHPVAAVRAGRALLALPTLDVSASESAPGRRIRAMSKRSTFGWNRPRYAVSVLAIAPRTTYLSGKARNTLRNNCNNASADEVSCRVVENRADQCVLARRVVEQRNELDNWPELRELIGTGRDLVFIVERHGEPLAIAFVTVDGPFSGLSWSLSVRDVAAASSARYLLFAYIVDVLATQGVEWLLGDGVVVLTDGLLYFQARLGFTYANLRFCARAPVQAHDPVGRPRVVLG